MSRNRIRRPALVLAALTASLLLVLGVAPARAAVAEESAASQSCWFDTDTDTAQCFADTPTMNAAIEAQTGGQLVTDANARPAGGVLMIYTVARFYDGVNYGPASFIVTTTSATYCTSSHTLNFTPAWDDRASSYQSYLGCQTSVWVGYGGTGASTPFATNDPIMSGVSNVGSSYTIT